MSIRARLFLVLLAVWLPGAVGFGLLARSSYLREVAAAQADVQQTAEALNAAVEMELGRRAAMARTLAASTAMAARDWPRLYADTAKAVFGTASWGLVLAADRQVFNTLQPFDPGTHIARVGTGDLVSGAAKATFVSRGPVTGEPTVAVLAPDHPERPGFNVGIAFLAAELQRIIAAHAVPAGAVAAVLDHQGVIVARNRDAQKWVGTLATADIRNRSEEGRHGFTESVTLDGVRSMTYLAPRNRYAWTVVIGLPAASLTAMADRMTLQAFAASGALLLAGLGVALFASRKITGPMVDLQQAALRLGQGQIPERVRTGVVEADAVAAALHEAGLQASTAKAELESRVAQAVDHAKRAQLDLLESRRLEALGRLSGGIAHDFNNLLQTISTSLQVTVRKHADGSPERRVIESAMRACGKAADLIRQMSDFGRPEHLAPQPIRIDDWLLGAQDVLNKALAGSGSLGASIDPGLPPVMADPAQFKLAMLNLVFNAREALADGGTIELRAQPAEAEQVAGLPPGDYLAVCVADTGCGMDAQVLAQATEPYFTTKGRGHGTGMGLTQVQSFARRSGGRLCLASRPGEGTQACIVLPVAPRVVPARAEPPAPRLRLPLRILMVEDDALAASVVVPTLEQHGHTVTLCRTADEARTLLVGPDDFDALFTDVIVPGEMNGLDLVRWAHQNRPMLPAVVATGFTFETLEEDLVVLNKPYDIGTLLKVLHRAAAARMAVA